MKCWAIHLPAKNGPNPLLTGSKNGMDGTIREEMLTFTPGIVRGLAFAIHCFTEKGDKVMVMPPVYHPFLSGDTEEREVVYSPLVLKDGNIILISTVFRKDVQGCKLLSPE